MYIIRYRHHPATLEKLYEVHMEHIEDHREDDHYIVARTRRAAVRQYLYHFGGTWPQRKRGVDCVHIGSII